MPFAMEVTDTEKIKKDIVVRCAILYYRLAKEI